MKFNILELFFIFWLSAFLWIVVEFIFHRISKRSNNQLQLGSSEEKHKTQLF